MQSQKPSWRNARRRPSAARRSSGSRSSTLSGSSSSEHRRLEAEEPGVDPMLAARLLGEPAHDPSPPRRATPNGARAGRPPSSPRRRGLRGRRAARRGRCRRRRRRSARQKRSPLQQLARPGAGGRRSVCRAPVSRQRISASAGHALAGDERARSARRGSRSAAESAGTPGPGRSGSRARGSGGRRSRPAAWEIDEPRACRRVPRPPHRITTAAGLTARAIIRHASAAMSAAPSLGSSRHTTSAASTATTSTPGPPTLIGRAFARVIAELEDKPTTELTPRARPRHAPDRARDGEPRTARGCSPRARPCSTPARSGPRCSISSSARATSTAA